MKMKTQGYLIVDSIHRAKDDELGLRNHVRVVCSLLSGENTQRICAKEITMILAQNNAGDCPVRVGQRLHIVIQDERIS
jgi:hypothetical protein